jgi:hypothetical protein
MNMFRRSVPAMRAASDAQGEAATPIKALMDLLRTQLRMVPRKGRHRAACSVAAVPVALPQVTVVDALMGSGKTTWALRMMADIAIRCEPMYEEGARRFLYVTPFLDEVARIKEALSKHHGLIAYDPKPKEGRKLSHLNELLADGRNIVSTHALLAHADEDTMDVLDEFQYTLIIDEVAEWVTRYPASADDLRLLYAQGVLSTEPGTRRVLWTDPEPVRGPDGTAQAGYRGKFDDLRSLCRMGKLVASRFGKLGEPTLLLWQFPVELLAKFSDVYILTHLFDGSDMAAYLALHGAKVTKATIGRDGSVVPYDAALERERVERVKPLIRVVNSYSLNAVGAKTGRSNPLSVSWFEQDDRAGGLKLRKLSKCLYTFFRHHAKTKASENAWATFKTYRADLAGGGYARGFIACNERATNKYRHKRSLAYCVNLYHHPYIRGYFQDARVELGEDFYALLTMAQWVFRSAIRDGQRIELYIPSERMRTLFLHWLDGELPEGTKVATKPHSVEPEEARQAEA